MEVKKTLCYMAKPENALFPSSAYMLTHLIILRNDCNAATCYIDTVHNSHSSAFQAL